MITLLVLLVSVMKQFVCGAKKYDSIHRKVDWPCSLALSSFYLTSLPYLLNISAIEVVVSAMVPSKSKIITFIDWFLIINSLEEILITY